MGNHTKLGSARRSVLVGAVDVSRHCADEGQPRGRLQPRGCSCHLDRPEGTRPAYSRWQRSMRLRRRACVTTVGVPRESSASSAQAVRPDRTHRHGNALPSARAGFRKSRLTRTCAESALGFSRRRVELGYHAFGNLISLAFECHEDRNRRAGMPSTTLAMTPIYPLRFTSRDKTDRTAQAATFKLLRRAAHNLILRSCWSQRRKVRLHILPLFAGVRPAK